MKIESIELIDRGYGGIVVTGIEASQKDRATVFMDVKKKYPIPLPEEITENLSKLKRYLLEMTNYWDSAFNSLKVTKGKLVDQKGMMDPEIEAKAVMIWDSCELRKVYRKKNGYMLTGVMSSLKTDRYFSIVTPLIDPDDGYENFNKLQTGVEHCFGLIASFIEDSRLKMLQPRQYALNFYGEGSPEIDRINNLPDEEVDEIMIKNLETRGHIVIKMDDVPAIPEHVSDSDIPSDDPSKSESSALSEDADRTDIPNFDDVPEGNTDNNTVEPTFENGGKKPKKDGSKSSKKN